MRSDGLKPDRREPFRKRMCIRKAAADSGTKKDIKEIEGEKK
jgi:hypothetical protein